MADYSGLSSGIARGMLAAREGQQRDANLALHLFADLQGTDDPELRAQKQQVYGQLFPNVKFAGPIAGRQRSVFDQPLTQAAPEIAGDFPTGTTVAQAFQLDPEHEGLNRRFRPGTWQRVSEERQRQAAERERQAGLQSESALDRRRVRVRAAIHDILTVNPNAAIPDDLIAEASAVGVPLPVRPETRRVERDVPQIPISADEGGDQINAPIVANEPTGRQVIDRGPQPTRRHIIVDSRTGQATGVFETGPNDTVHVTTPRSNGTRQVYVRRGDRLVPIGEVGEHDVIRDEHVGRGGTGGGTRGGSTPQSSDEISPTDLADVERLGFEGAATWPAVARALRERGIVSARAHRAASDAYRRGAARRAQRPAPGSTPGPTSAPTPAPAPNAGRGLGQQPPAAPAAAPRVSTQADLDAAEQSGVNGVEWPVVASRLQAGGVTDMRSHRLAIAAWQRGRSSRTAIQSR